MTTLTVDTFIDEQDGDTSAGDLSLREAIALADPGETIVFANGGALGFDGFLAAEAAETDGVFNDAATNREDIVAYFSFLGANPDGAEHIRSFGDNIFGFEDLPANLGDAG